MTSKRLKLSTVHCPQPPVHSPLLFLLLALLALPVDCAISQWFIQDCPATIKGLLRFGELFGHGVGVVVVALLIWQLDPGRRRAKVRVITIAVVAGLAADVVKLFVERTRPYHFNLDSSVLQSFSGWLPLIGQSDHQSFPSAHTATAVGLAIALTWLYPRGKWVFPSFAALVAIQRVASGYHFLSDVLVGAAVGMLAGILFLKTGPIAHCFDQWESRSSTENIRELTRRRGDTEEGRL